MYIHKVSLPMCSTIFFIASAKEVLYLHDRLSACLLLGYPNTTGWQLPAFPLEDIPGTEPRPQRWEGRVLPLCHCGHYNKHTYQSCNITLKYKGLEGISLSGR